MRGLGINSAPSITHRTVIHIVIEWRVDVRAIVGVGRWRVPAFAIELCDMLLEQRFDLAYLQSPTTAKTTAEAALLPKDTTGYISHDN